MAFVRSILCLEVLKLPPQVLQLTHNEKMMNASRRLTAAIAAFHLVPLPAGASGKSPAQALHGEIASGVYVAGVEKGGPLGKDKIATVWKDGDALCRFSDAAEARSVFAADKGVHAAGGGSSKPGRHWVNGADLGQGIAGSRNFYCVYVSGDDAYLAGEATSGAPKYWKNGLSVEMDTPSLRYGGRWGDAKTFSVFVAGKDVYLAGGGKYTWNEFRTSYSPSTEKIVNDAHKLRKYTYFVWKNGKTLYELDTFCPHSIWVSPSGAICVAGGGEKRLYSGIPDAWLSVNGQHQWLSGDDTAGQAFSVHGAGEDVYAAGWERKKKDRKAPRVATIWKNGKIHWRLSPETHDAQANSIFVFGDDVYAAGWEQDKKGKNAPKVAVIWKNGAVHQRLTAGKTDAEAFSVFVK
jgi:hypothetical protein